ncbi:MAG: hypothetical protein [Virus sp.]|nr:MAG: hypothetical protein [Virus sp.]
MSYRCCRYAGTVDCYPCVDYSKFWKRTSPLSSQKALLAKPVNLVRGGLTGRRQIEPELSQRTPGQSSIRQVIRRLPMEVWNGEYL